MKFSDVVEDLANWKKVRRKSWKDGVYLYMEHNVVHEYSDDSDEGDLPVLSRKDLLAEDWEVIEK